MAKVKPEIFVYSSNNAEDREPIIGGRLVVCQNTKKSLKEAVFEAWIADFSQADQAEEREGLKKFKITYASDGVKASDGECQEISLTKVELPPGWEMVAVLQASSP